MLLGMRRKATKAGKASAQSCRHKTRRGGPRCVAPMLGTWVGLFGRPRWSNPQNAVAETALAIISVAAQNMPTSDMPTPKPTARTMAYWRHCWRP